MACRHRSFWAASLAPSVSAWVRLVSGSLSGQFSHHLHWPKQLCMPHHAFEMCIDPMPEHFRSDDTEPKLPPGSVKARLR
jgi:hypothetical protein